LSLKIEKAFKTDTLPIINISIASTA